ncbi:hypothetical protein JW835_15945 [bacterium]|nr:hypothetical protein [bacterium]
MIRSKRIENFGKSDIICVNGIIILIMLLLTSMLHSQVDPIDPILPIQLSSDTISQKQDNMNRSLPAIPFTYDHLHKMLLTERGLFFQTHFFDIIEYTDVIYDTLFSNYLSGSDQELCFKALVVCATAKDSANIIRTLSTLKQYNYEDYMAYRGYINSARSFLSKSIQRRIRTRPNAQYAQQIANTSDFGLNLIIELYHSLKSELDSASDSLAAAQSAQLLLAPVAEMALNVGMQMSIAEFTGLSMSEIQNDIFWMSIDKEINEGAPSELYNKYQPPRYSILIAVSTINNPELIPALKNHLIKEDCDKLMTKCIYKGWANIGADALPSILDLLEDKKSRKHSRHILAQLTDPEAKHQLVLMIDDAKDTDVICYLIEMIGELNYKEAVPKIESLMEHTDKKVRKTAEKTLKILTE